MDRPPISYLQTDPRWAGQDYSAPGERTTVRASGCGPTAMAMVLATWADPAVTPATEAAWALAHGWKCPRSGTYYGYFAAAAARYGLTCRRLNGATVYGRPDDPVHAQAAQALRDGKLVLSCMGPGDWTRSGHYVLCWRLDGGVVRIHDPASTRAARTRASWSHFCAQVKYHWVIDPPKEGANDMTKTEVKALIREVLAAQASAPVPAWAEPELRAAIAAGITDGSDPMQPVPRYQAAIMALRAARSVTDQHEK